MPWHRLPSWLGAMNWRAFRDVLSQQIIYKLVGAHDLPSIWNQEVKLQ
jgi:hypothetical protein